jgi:transposase InsO family protein
VDRSADTSPTDFFDRLTAGISGDRAIFARDIMWQLHNGLDYYGKHTRPSLPMLDVPPSMLYLPLVVWDNAAAGRDVVMTDGAATSVRAAYGPLLPIERDPRVPAPRLSEQVAGLPAGTPYVLGLIESYPETPLDSADMAAVAARLGLPGGVPRSRYAVVAGKIGSPPVLHHEAAEPFRVSAGLAGRRVDARIECWLPADTIRRMGFGQVIVDRRRVLTLDRGASFVALDATGRAVLVAWAGGLLAPQPRWVIRHEGVRK